jgi:hypothetical protein
MRTLVHILLALFTQLGLWQLSAPAPDPGAGDPVVHPLGGGDADPNG